jgi:hypothetical protein
MLGNPVIVDHFEDRFLTDNHENLGMPFDEEAAKF